MSEKKPLAHSPFIRTLYADPQSGHEIEELSFAIIDREAPPHRFSPEEWQVVRRMIHTTGDFAIMDNIRFSPQAIAKSREALRSGCPVYTDSNMMRAGLSMARLQAVHGAYNSGRIFCHIADSDVAGQAREAHLPRSLFAIRKAKSVLHGGIVAFGNAPVALLELNRMIIEENIRPALVIAMPVGFVHVLESKEELMSLDIPYIALAGRRGGSPLAVSVLHALCSIAQLQSGGTKEGV